MRCRAVNPVSVLVVRELPDAGVSSRDASIRAYTVATVMFVLGALGLQRTQMAHRALLALSGGLIVAVPTAITGLIE